MIDVIVFDKFIEYRYNKFESDCFDIKKYPNLVLGLSKFLNINKKNIDFENIMSPINKHFVVIAIAPTTKTVIHTEW